MHRLITYLWTKEMRESVSPVQQSRLPVWACTQAAPRSMSPQNPSAQQRAPALTSSEESRESSAEGSWVPLHCIPAWMTGGGALCGQHPLLSLSTALIISPHLCKGSGAELGLSTGSVASKCHSWQREPWCVTLLFAVVSGTARDSVGWVARADAPQKCFWHVFGMCRACHLYSTQTLWSWMPERTSGRTRLLSCRELIGCREFSAINSPLCFVRQLSRLAVALIFVALILTSARLTLESIYSNPRSQVFWTVLARYSHKHSLQRLL